MTKQQAVEKIRRLVEDCRSFEIGKTGHSLREKFERVYRDSYDEIHPVCGSPNRTMVEEWEAFLVHAFQQDRHFRDRCRRSKSQGGRMSRSGRYNLFVVLKK